MSIKPIHVQSISGRHCIFCWADHIHTPCSQKRTLRFRRLPVAWTTHAGTHIDRQAVEKWASRRFEPGSRHSLAQRSDISRLELQDTGVFLENTTTYQHANCFLLGCKISQCASQVDFKSIFLRKRCSSYLRMMFSVDWNSWLATKSNESFRIKRAYIYMIIIQFLAFWYISLIQTHFKNDLNNHVDTFFSQEPLTA